MKRLMITVAAVAAMSAFGEAPAAKPNDFNPYAPRPKKPILRGKQLEILRDVFVKNAPAPK